MTRQEKSTELIPLSDQEVQNDQPAPRNTLHRRIWRKIVTVRWRELITASIIVLDLFLLYASISLIGVFFPTEVSRECLIHKERYNTPDDCQRVEYSVIIIIAS